MPEIQLYLSPEYIGLIGAHKPPELTKEQFMERLIAAGLEQLVEELAGREGDDLGAA